MTILNTNMLAVVAALAMFAPAVPAVSAGELEIVANPSVKVAGMTAGEARDVFIADSTSVGGSKVVPMVLRDSVAQEQWKRRCVRKGPGD